MCIMYLCLVYDRRDSVRGEGGQNRIKVIYNISLVFETYQKARMVFVQAMAELATRSTNVKCLESAGVIGMFL